MKLICKNSQKSILIQYKFYVFSGGQDEPELDKLLRENTDQMLDFEKGINTQETHTRHVFDDSLG